MPFLFIRIVGFEVGRKLRQQFVREGVALASTKQSGGLPRGKAATGGNPVTSLLVIGRRVTQFNALTRAALLCFFTLCKFYQCANARNYKTQYLTFTLMYDIIHLYAPSGLNAKVSLL